MSRWLVSSVIGIAYLVLVHKPAPIDPPLNGLPSVPVPASFLRGYGSSGDTASTTGHTTG
jgi:hypothetical protein